MHCKWDLSITYGNDPMTDTLVLCKSFVSHTVGTPCCQFLRKTNNVLVKAFRNQLNFNNKGCNEPKSK